MELPNICVSALKSVFPGLVTGLCGVGFPETCGRYVEERGRSRGTIRRELGMLRAAINYAHRSGRITRPVVVELPERAEPRD